MKTHLCLLALFTSATALSADDPVSNAVAALGLLPNQRAGLHIKADERNPFAVQPKEIAKASAPDDTETQESKIRSIFRELRVTGVRRDRNGRSVALAGDLILRQGEEVKPVLEDQTETLIVSKIEPHLIELTFVEDKDSTQPRIIPLSVKNQVQVSQKLFGQPKGKARFYVARGRTAADVEEAAAAIAVAPPTAPANASPLVTASTGTSVPAEPRDGRREAAALAGLSEPALAELIGPRTSSPAENSTSGPVATPPPPADPAPSSATTGSPTAGESAPPPTHARRRSAPPSATEQPPPPPGTSLVE